MNEKTKILVSSLYIDDILLEKYRWLQDFFKFVIALYSPKFNLSVLI